MGQGHVRKKVRQLCKEDLDHQRHTVVNKRYLKWARFGEKYGEKYGLLLGTVFIRNMFPYFSMHLANTALCSIRETWNPEPAFESGEGLFQSRGMPQRQALILPEG